MRGGCHTSVGGLGESALTLSRHARHLSSFSSFAGSLSPHARDLQLSRSGSACTIQRLGEVEGQEIRGNAFSVLCLVLRNRGFSVLTVYDGAAASIGAWRS